MSMAALVWHGGRRRRVVDDLLEGLERGAGEVIEVVGDAIGAAAAMGVDGAAKGDVGAEPEMDRGPVDACRTSGSADGPAGNEAANHFLLSMAQGVQDGGMG